MTKQIFLIDFAISSLYFSSIFFVIEFRKYLIMTNIINNENLNTLKKSYNNLNNININAKIFYNLMNAINEIAQNILTKFSFSHYNVDIVFIILIFLYKISNTRFTFNSLFDFLLNSTISSNLKFYTFRNTFSIRFKILFQTFLIISWSILSCNKFSLLIKNHLFIFREKKS